MAKLHLVVTSVSLLFATALAAAAEDDATLLKQAKKHFKPLTNIVVALDFPTTAPRVELGRMLFFDPRLTIDANMSCSTCHQPALYGTDGRPRSIGVQQRPHPRNAPTVLNAALSIIHWCGDRDGLEDKVAKPLTSPITSGQPDTKAVLQQLGRIPGYSCLLRGGFPDERNPMSAENISRAISAFERTLLTPSPFDAYLTGDVDALSPTARAGLEKFINTGCVACHEGVGVGGSIYRKFGLVEDYWKATGSQTIDKGRVDVTKDPEDLYVFRVPSLRNVAMTAPYFHDGSVPTLPEAVKGMGRVQLGVTLSDLDTHDIVAFLESLTGDLPASFATIPPLPSGTVFPAK